MDNWAATPKSNSLICFYLVHLGSVGKEKVRERERVSEWVSEREREGKQERQRERERGRDRQTDRQTTDRQTEKEAETERQLRSILRTDLWTNFPFPKQLAPNQWNLVEMVIRSCFFTRQRKKSRNHARSWAKRWLRRENTPRKRALPDFDTRIFRPKTRKSSKCRGKDSCRDFFKVQFLTQGRLKEIEVLHGWTRVKKRGLSCEMPSVARRLVVRQSWHGAWYKRVYMLFLIIRGSRDVWIWWS